MFQDQSKLPTENFYPQVPYDVPPYLRAFPVFQPEDFPLKVCLF
jgi:hypothetical protein